MRFAIRQADQQFVSGPNGGPLGTAQDPLVIVPGKIPLAWQILDPVDESAPPVLLPVGAVFTFNFKSVGDFNGTTVANLDPDSPVVRPVTGTGAGYLVNHSGSAYPVGTTSIRVDAGTGTILAGDVVRIAAYSYVVATDLSGTVFAIAEPGLRESVADDEPVTIVSSTDFYTGVLLANTTAIDALLSPNVDFVKIAANFTSNLSGAPDEDATIGQRVFATVDNTYYQPGDAVAVSAGSPDRFLPLVVGITGGGSTKLDGIPTIGKGYNLVHFVNAGTGLVWYQLTAGTDATSAPGTIRPPDYDGSTNAFVWKSVS